MNKYCKLGLNVYQHKEVYQNGIGKIKKIMQFQYTRLLFTKLLKCIKTGYEVYNYEKFNLNIKK